MSRQSKPDGVDVLHYRFYSSVMKGMELEPHGGLTLAVQWPVWDESNILRVGAARCSLRDHFVRKTGFNKALGRLLSFEDHHEDYVTDAWWSSFSDLEHPTFSEKCTVLHELFTHPFEVGDGSLADYIFANSWVNNDANQLLPTLWLVRNSSPKVTIPPMRRYPNDVWTGCFIGWDW